MAPAADAKGLVLDVHIDDPSAAVVGDPVRSRQIVWNFVANAVKFTKQGGVSSELCALQLPMS